MTSAAFGPIKTATVNDTTLAYREEGTGEPVVFVHGAFTDLRSWEPQLEALGRTNRAIAFSFRFSRPNQHLEPGTGELWPLHVEDLAGLLRKLDAAPAHLVGNSSGALFSLAVAQRYPGLVRSVVAEEPPAVGLFVSIPPGPMELLRVLTTRPRTALGIMKFGATMTKAQMRFRRGNDEKAARGFIRDVAGRAGLERVSKERWVQVFENMDDVRATAFGAAVLPPIDDDGVRGIHAPVLLLMGEQSPRFFSPLADRLEQLLPNAERAEIPNASHLMHEDNAQAVNEAILKFIARHGSPNS